MMAIPVSIGVLGGAVFCSLLMKLLQRNRALSRQAGLGQEAMESEAWSEDWFAEFSTFRYLPMRRVLAHEEETFWMESVGESRATLAQFRAERRELFRGYLQLLRADFERLSVGVRLAVTLATDDQSGELQKLIGMEWTFRKLLWMAEARLALHWAGVEPLDADVLINAMQGFEFTLREAHLSAVQAAS